MNFEINDPGVTEFIFIDARQGGVETVSLRDENKSVTVLGDKNFSPPVPVILKAKLQEKLGSKLISKKVSLSYLVIEIHERDPKIDETAYSTSQAASGNKLPDSLARWLIKGMERLTNSKIVIVELKGSLDEQEFSVAVNGYFKRDAEIEIKEVVLTAIDNAVNSIDGLLNEKIQ